MNTIQMNKLQASLVSLNKALDTSTSQMSTNRKFDAGSDDLKSFDVHLEVKNKITMIGEVHTDIDHALLVDQGIEQAFFAAEDMMEMVYTEMVKASSNGYYKYEDRQIIKNTIGDVQSGILDIANTRINGQYVFSGQFSEKKPYDISDFTVDPLTNLKEFNYRGAENNKEIYVDENIKKEYGVTGDAFFNQSGLLSIFESITKLLESPETAINDEVSYDLNMLYKDFLEDQTVVIGNQVNTEPALSVAQKTSFETYSNNLKEYAELNTRHTVADLTSERDSLLLDVPGLGDNPDRINKIFDMAMYADDLKTYGQTADNGSFNKVMDGFLALTDDANYGAEPYTPADKETLKYMLDLATYKNDLKQYGEQQKTENYDAMQISKEFVMGEATSSDAWKIQQGEQFETSAIIANSALQADPALTLFQKGEYQTYTDLMKTFYSEPTTVNYDAITAQKAVLDGSGMAPAYNDETQKMYDYTTYLHTDNGYSASILTTERKEEVNNMFELAKNPMSEKLEEFETIREFVSYEHAEIGVKMDYMSRTGIRLQQQKLDLDVFYSETVSMDMAEVALNLQATTNSINALYSVIAQLQSLSLTKYL